MLIFNEIHQYSFSWYLVAAVLGLGGLWSGPSVNSKPQLETDKETELVYDFDGIELEQGRLIEIDRPTRSTHQRINHHWLIPLAVIDPWLGVALRVYTEYTEFRSSNAPVALVLSRRSFRLANIISVALFLRPLLTQFFIKLLYTSSSRKKAVSSWCIRRI